MMVKLKFLLIGASGENSATQEYVTNGRKGMFGGLGFHMHTICAIYADGELFWSLS